MTQTCSAHGMARALVPVFVAAMIAVGAWAQDADPLIMIDLPTTGPQYQFGRWLEDSLADEAVQVCRRPRDKVSRLPEAPLCIVTWSDPERGPGEMKRLREHVRSGGGVVYVIGEGRAHFRKARAFLGPLDIDVREADGGAAAPEWASHPLTEGSPALGAVNAGSTISGAGASPLIRIGGRQIAAAFDWGPLGRAVVLDQSVLFDQLHEASPRPAVRDFLVRATLWAGRAGEQAPKMSPRVQRPKLPSREELIRQEPVGAMQHNTAVVDLPTEKNDWPELRGLLLAELEGAGIAVDEPQRREGAPLLASQQLDRAGLVVIGSGRETEEVHWSEPLALGWFFEHGGRILAISHAAGGTMGRMAGFNSLLTQLRISVSLERGNGRAHFEKHPITEGIRPPEDGFKVQAGALVWAPLTEPLVTMRGRPAAVAWQSDQGRVVVIDGQLLLTQGGMDRPYPEMVTLLRNSIEWLMGEL